MYNVFNYKFLAENLRADFRVEFGNLFSRFSRSRSPVTIKRVSNEMSNLQVDNCCQEISGPDVFAAGTARYFHGKLFSRTYESSQGERLE